MKGNKLLSIDTDLLEKLSQEPNQSALVSDLLKAHYEISLDRRALDIQEKELKKTIKEAKNKLKMIPNMRKRAEKDQKFKGITFE